MKIPKLPIFIAGLETTFIVFLILLHNWALNSGYGDFRWETSESASAIAINPFSSGVLFFLFTNAIILLTIGICGFGRQYFKNHQDLFTAITAVLVPSVLLSFLCLSLSNLAFGF
jgi:hypothetical protein